MTRIVPSRPGPDPADPPLFFPPYASTALRAPAVAPVPLPSAALTNLPRAPDWTRLFEREEADLTARHAVPPIGQRIVVHGRVLDEAARPLRGAVIEIWQANAAGRYAHARDQWDAPLDPNFTGAGRSFTDADGAFAFVTVRPGAYPWRNHHNAWRPAHIHLSVLGAGFADRLVTQMYFPDDPLIDIDPIACAVPLPYRRRMVARFDIGLTRPNWALGYRFDLVLRGPAATPFET